MKGRSNIAEFAHISIPYQMIERIACMISFRLRKVGLSTLGIIDLKWFTVWLEEIGEIRSLKENLNVWAERAFTNLN
ncbi:uncharacterized protein [Bemisia tabaci]|uniref:uncharacterized protein n=1 Tax=Bemisia tabaci TaxID=7038 RepID=UPI003B27E7AA